MHRKFWIALAIFSLTVLLVPVVNAAQEFSNKDVDGPTAFAFDGWVTLGGALVPGAATGRFIADGRGHISDGVRTLMAGGVLVLHQTFTCDYSVNADGTGSATCPVATVTPTGIPNSVETFDFVIVEKKKEAFFTSTTAGSVLRGATKRQQ